MAGAKQEKADFERDSASCKIHIVLLVAFVSGIIAQTLALAAAAPARWRGRGACGATDVAADESPRVIAGGCHFMKQGFGSNNGGTISLLFEGGQNRNANECFWLVMAGPTEMTSERVKSRSVAPSRRESIN
jgi:hypothetical protein